MGKFGDYPDAWDESSEPRTADPRQKKDLFDDRATGNVGLLRRFGKPMPRRVSAVTLQPTKPEETGQLVSFVLQRIAAITEAVRNERENMIPTSAAGTQGAKKRTGFPYLTIEHLSKTPQPAKILACKVDTEGRFGTRIVLKLAFKQETFLWTLTVKNNPNVQTLTDKFGNDENEWVGQSINIFAEQDDFSGNVYPRVSFPKK